LTSNNILKGCKTIRNFSFDFIQLDTFF